MKKLFLLLTCFAFAMAFTLSSCSSDDDDSDPKRLTYVKYEVESCSKVINLSGDVEYSSDKEIGYTKFSSSYNWEKICGPFKKGDAVYLSVDTWDAGVYHNARLSISIDGGPWVVKDQKANTLYSNLTYTIEL